MVSNGQLNLFENERVQKKIANSDIPLFEQEWVFTEYVPDTRQKIEGHKKTKEYLDNLETNYKSGKGMFFWGDIDSPKNHFGCHILLEACRKKQYSIYYISYPSLINHFIAFDYDNDMIVDKLYQIDFLGIFEIGLKYVVNAKTNTRFADLLNRRLIRNQPTILTSNIDVGIIGTEFTQYIESLIRNKNQIIGV